MASSSPIALVTGGAGFIGSHIAHALAKRGVQVRVIDDLSSSEGSDLDDLDGALVRGDIRNSTPLPELVQGSNWIFHQAALVSVPGSIEEPERCYAINVEGTLNVLRAAHQAGVERVVLASSAAVYGESGEPIAEDHEKKPLSPYAASKLAMEEAALMYHRVYGLPVVCLRYFNVYGPRQRPDSPYAAVIPAFIRAMLEGRPPVIYGDGEQRRDFVYVDDVVRANLLAVEREQAVGGIFNIGGGGSISINELAGILQSILPDGPESLYGPPREGDIHFSEADLRKAEQSLGYRPEVGIQEGLRKTVKWFLNHQLEATR